MTLDVRVQRARCIATRACINAAGRTFALDATEVAVVTDPAGDSDDDILSAAEACPTGAITVYRDGVQIA